MPRTAVATTLSPRVLDSFNTQSFAIEGLSPSDFSMREQRVTATLFLDLPTLHVPDVVQVCHMIEPNARLRSHPGMNVWVGDHRPPGGGHHVVTELGDILSRVTSNEQSPFLLHYQFERLHPFTDGNGRTGRLVWLWQMTHHHGYDGRYLFLQSWYYASLA